MSIESIEEFVKRIGVTAEIKFVGASDVARTYDIQYRCASREFTLRYNDYAECPRVQIPTEALDEAASEAASVENSSNLWEWCSQFYGVEPDSSIIIDPEEMYLIHQRQTRDLKDFLGEANFNQLLNGVKRLYEEG